MDYEFLFKRLRDIREDNNLKQKDIAKILNISRPNYTRWETREKIIPLTKLNEFCNFFKVSMDYVVGFTNENKEYLYNESLNKSKISSNIKLLRIKNNLTQQQLADIINADQSVISDYENNVSLILTSFAIDICKKFNVSLDWLCGRK